MGGSRNVPLPLPLIGGEQAGSDSIAQALRRVERNKRIVGLVLHVDSPGGDAFASDLIWREVLRVRRKKPVVVAMRALGDLPHSPMRSPLPSPLLSTKDCGYMW